MFPAVFSVLFSNWKHKDLMSVSLTLFMDMKLKQLKTRLGKEVKSAIPPECSAAPSHASWSSFFSWRNGSFCHSRVSAGWEDGPPLQPVCAAGSLYVWIFFLASLSSACCGPHSFPVCIQGQNKTSLRITVTQDLEDLQSLATTLSFSPWKDTKILTTTPGLSRARLVTRPCPALLPLELYYDPPRGGKSGH